MFTSAPEAARTPFVIWEEQLPKDQRPKRPALMMEDNQDGQGFGMGFKGFAKEYGYTFAIDEPYAPGSKDFSSHILKWKAAKVDALLWLGSPTDSITLLRQMKEQNLKLKYIHGWKGFWPTEFLQAMGKDANYIIHDGFWAETLPNPGAKELGQRFKKQFKMDSVSIGLYYANPQILAMAIEKAGSIDSAKVRDAVFGGEFKGTMMGDVKYNAKGLCFKPFLALQWWDGQRMPVYPPLPSVWKLKLAPEK
jgi:branched-chain amino acid transport system substrate-binding protein